MENSFAPHACCVRVLRTFGRFCSILGSKAGPSNGLEFQIPTPSRIVQVLFVREIPNKLFGLAAQSSQIGALGSAVFGVLVHVKVLFRSKRK